VPRLMDGSSEPQKHTRSTAQQREGFFRVFDRTGSVTDAAAKLGLNRNTCYQWVRKAGLARKRADGPTREDFRRLRDKGLSRREAARELGIHRTTAEEWDSGVRRTKNGRIYPGGRTVDYTSGVMTMTTPAGAAVSLPFPGLAALEKPLDPRFLSLQDRERIADLHSHGKSRRKIAEELGRAASTISRELARNSVSEDGYYAYAAQRAAAARRPRPKDRKLLADSRLRKYVKNRLLRRWSPEQISRKLVRKFPNDPEMRVSPETIYQALYLQARGGLKREVQAALRTGRARRKPHKDPQQRQSRFVDPMVMISERPAEVKDRAVPGHWEGDLITGANNQSAIGTLVERTTRYVMLVHLSGDHTAETVRDGLIATMSTLPDHLRGSLTWDQGAEMAAHKSFTLATDMQVYFCDPGSPWQRGSNENTNGLLRQYFEKGTDLSIYGPEDLEHVAQELNGRPRKTLDWDTPAERLRDLLMTT
jgi:transposase, IS30 family